MATGWSFAALTMSGCRGVRELYFLPPRHPVTPTPSPRVRAVIRSFSGDDNIVRMALAQPGRGDPHEACLALQGRDVRGTNVPHRRAQTADKLVDEIAKRTLVGHPTLDPLWDEFLDVADPFLEIAVLRVGTGFHGADGTHAPIFLEALPLVEHDFAWTLVDPCQQ